MEKPAASSYLRHISMYLPLFLLSLVPVSGRCGNGPDRLEPGSLTPRFYDTRWFVNAPASYLDDSVRFENGGPAFYLSGYYSSASKNGNRISPADSVLSVCGHIRIDSLAGEVDIAVRCWDGSSRKRIHHLGEFHRTMTGARPAQWQAFRIDLPLCPQMKEFDLEIKIRGTGSLWIGELRSVSVPYTAPGFTAATADKRRRNTHYRPYFGPGEDLSAQQVENLAVLGKVWGFLKYFHPTVRSGAVDWDAELFRMIPPVVNAEAGERNELLLEWCEGLGTFPLSRDASALDENDALGWIRDTAVLGRELSGVLQKTACAERSLYHGNLYQIPHILAVGDKNEKTWPRMSFSDLNLKWLAVFRVWNYVQYFYPYRNLADTPWEDALEPAIEAMTEAENGEEYGNVLNAMGVLTDDSHTYAAWRPKNIFKFFGNRNRIPNDMQYAAPFFTTKYHDGKYFVTWAFRASGSDLVPGDAIIAMDGETVDGYIGREGSLLPASNDSRRPRDLALAVSGSGTASKTYTVIRNGDTLALTPRLMPLKEFRREAYRSGIRQSTLVRYGGRELRAFDTIADSVAYLHAEDMTVEDFRKALEYGKIIVDLRNYPRNMAQLWLMSLLEEVKPIATVVYPDLLNPGIFHTASGDRTGVGRNYRPGRSIVLLVDENTQSASEYTSMVLQTSPQVVTVGSTTAGANGNVVKISLPGEYVFQIGGVGVRYPDGTQTQRCGVRIDCPVDETPDIGSDRMIARALSLL